MIAAIRASLTIFLLTLTLGLMAPAPANAQACDEGRTFFTFPTWDQYLEKNEVQGCTITGFSFPGDIWLVVLALLDMAFILGAYIAAGFIIYGGFLMMSGQGAPEKIAQARKVIADAITGLIITLIATAIIDFVANRFT